MHFLWFKWLSGNSGALSIEKKSELNITSGWFIEEYVLQLYIHNLPIDCAESPSIGYVSHFVRSSIWDVNWSVAIIWATSLNIIWQLKYLASSIRRSHQMRNRPIALPYQNAAIFPADNESHIPVVWIIFHPISIYSRCMIISGVMHDSILFLHFINSKKDLFVCSPQLVFRDRYGSLE